MIVCSIRGLITLTLLTVLGLSGILSCSSEDPDRSWIGANLGNIAVMDTSMGKIAFELYEAKAPITTANFKELAEGGFYKDMIFHRVVKDFVIQTGDPTGTGSGGSPNKIELEIHPDLKHVDGAVGMARSMDPNSASSQFYICVGAQHGLDGDYAVFGKVIDGMDVVRAISEVQVGAGSKPLKAVKLNSVTVINTDIPA